MVKEGRVGFPRRQTLEPTSPLSCLDGGRITLAQFECAPHFLRGSDTVPFGLRTAVLVVTYFPEEAERCGPLGGDLLAIPVSYTDITRPYPALAPITVICQKRFRNPYLVGRLKKFTSSSGQRIRTRL